MNEQSQSASPVSSNLAATILSTARDAVVVADSNGRIMLWNRAAEVMFGSLEAEVKGQPLTILMPERFQQAHAQGMQRYLTSGQAHMIGQIVELVGRRKTGEEFPLELALSSFNQDGRVWFTAVIRDVTDHKQVEERFKKDKEALERQNKIMMDREGRVVELKREVNALLRELGRPPAYSA